MGRKGKLEDVIVVILEDFLTMSKDDRGENIKTSPADTLVPVKPEN